MKDNSGDSCRICNSNTREVISLGNSPPANNFIESAHEVIKEYPLDVLFCDECKGLQLKDCLDEEDLYGNYTYMTPNTKSQVDHYNNLINFLKNKSIVNLSTKCLELGSNTGLFLQTIKPYVKSVLGVDPARNIAEISMAAGIDTIVDFFNPSSAQKIKENQGLHDLIIARHMFAHNKDPKKMLKGIDKILADKGFLVIENAYAIPTLENGELDQIYHEHMFYYCVNSMSKLLDLFSLELISLFNANIHGGSLAFIVARKGTREAEPIVQKYLNHEEQLFLEDKIFNSFNLNSMAMKDKILKLLKIEKSLGRSIGAYGATAKSFTMFSFLGLTHETIKYCVDTTPTKIGKFFPSFNIPVISEEKYLEDPVDTFIVTAWNYKEHILEKAPKLMKRGTKLIFPLPFFEIIEI